MEKFCVLIMVVSQICQHSSNCTLILYQLYQDKVNYKNKEHKREGDLRGKKKQKEEALGLYSIMFPSTTLSVRV